MPACASPHADRPSTARARDIQREIDCSPRSPKGNRQVCLLVVGRNGTESSNTRTDNGSDDSGSYRWWWCRR
jgi:hypothetical protein